ncbi:hypothetical protein [Streptomyces sp. 1222.5]|uniref:hypothetical protein n=1 Tax=Streptomyces sp. 1222.5 TaxID=1881026 RepID=UPI003D7033B5
MNRQHTKHSADARPLDSQGEASGLASGSDIEQAMKKTSSMSIEVVDTPRTRYQAGEVLTADLRDECRQE